MKYKQPIFASALLTLSIGAYALEMNGDLTLDDTFFPTASSEITTTPPSAGGLYDILQDDYSITGNKHNLTANTTDAVVPIGYRQLYTNGTISELGDISNLGLTFDALGNVTGWTTQGLNGFEGAFTQGNYGITITDSVFTDNSSYKYTYYADETAQAESKTSGADYYILNGNIDMTNSAIIGNTSKENAGTLIKSGNGGSTFANSVFYNNDGMLIDIRWAAANAKTSTINNSIFAGNSGKAVVYALSAHLDVNASIFKKNSADYVIQSASSGTSYTNLKVSESQFTDNTSKNVIASSGVTSINSTLFDNNSGTSVNANNATYSDTTITNSTFSNNTATSVSNYGKMLIEGTNSNASNSLLAGLEDNTSEQVLTSSESKFSNNSAMSVSNNGSTAQLVIKNTTFENNSFTSIDNNAINTDTSIISATINDSIFKNNTSWSVYNKGSMQINNTTFENNACAVTIANSATGTLTINDSTFTGATSGDSIESAGTLTINNSVFKDNITKGRPVDVTAATTTVNNSIFDNNGMNGSYGGAANVNSNATLVLNDSTFTNNTASQGGAVYLQASNGNANAIFNVTKDQINYGNTAGGGFIFFKNQSSTPAEAINIATFNIDSNARMTIGSAYNTSDDGFSSGYTAGGSTNANIIKTGSGDLAINSSLMWYAGTIDVQEGTMYINQRIGASDYTAISDTDTSRNAITIGQSGSLALRLWNWNDPLTSTSGITLENNGTLILTANPNEPANVSTPITTNKENFTYTGSGVIKAYGMTYDDNIADGAKTYAKTATNVYSGGAMHDVYANSNNRLTVDGYDNFELSFYTKDVFSVIGIDAYDASDNGYIESAFKVSTNSATDETSIMMTFYMENLDTDIVYSVTDFKIYNSEDGEIWNAVTSSDLDYLQFDGSYLEFAYGQENGYDNSKYWGWGYSTAVPEPSTYAMILGSIALGFAIYRRRK